MPSSVITTPYREKRILLTGAHGYIGSALALRLASEEVELVLIDSVDARKPVGQNVRAVVATVSGDVTDESVWDAVLPAADYVFHLAAVEEQYSPHIVERDLRVNALSVHTLLSSCQRQRVAPVVVLASSSNIYGTVERLPVDEDAPDDPQRIWSAHKLLAEQYLKILGGEYCIPSVVLRLANVYGPTADKNLADRVVLNKVIRRALSGHPLEVFANKDCIRDFVFLDDVVDAFVLAGAVAAQGWRRYVIGSGEGKRIEEIWRMIAERIEHFTGRAVELLVNEQVRLRPDEMRHFVANSGRFRDATGWQARIFLQEGIDRTIAWLRA